MFFFFTFLQFSERFYLFVDSTQTNWLNSFCVERDRGSGETDVHWLQIAILIYFTNMKLQVNCVAAILLLAVVSLGARVNGFTRQHLNSNALEHRQHLRKSHKNDDQLDRRRAQLDESVEDEPSDVDDQPPPPNFLLIDYLNDGEIERRVSFNGIAAKETSVANSGWVKFSHKPKACSNRCVIFFFFCFRQKLFGVKPKTWNVPHSVSALNMIMPFALSCRLSALLWTIWT